MTYYREGLEKIYKNLFEHSLDLIYVNDLSGNFLDANDLTLIALGYEKEEIPNIKFLDILEESDLRRAFGVLKEILKTGKQSKRMEYKIRANNGNFIYIETYGMPLRQNGKIYAILGIGKNITERKKAEQKLIDSEEMFRALYKEGPIATYTWKKLEDDFVFIEFNNAAEKLTHGNVLKILGYKASEVYADRLDILDDLHECFKEKINITREMKYRFGFTNEEKYLLVNYGFVKPDLVVVQTEDFTEKRIAEEKLRESEEKYRNLLHHLDVGFYQVKLDGQMLNYNQAHNKILGYDPAEDFRDKNVTMFWQYPEQRDVYLKHISENSFAKNYICHALGKDGKKLVVELNSHLIKDKKGKPIRIDGTFIDITEKFTLERELKESEEKYRYLFENTPFSIILINSKGKIIDCNPTTEIMFGYTKEDLKGKRFHKISVIDPDHLPLLIDLFKKFIKGEEVHRLDLKIYKKDRNIAWVNLQASLVQVEDEYLVQAIFNDITKRKEAEFLVNEEMMKLKELDKIRKNLVSRVAHELKTPLASVCAGVELLTNVYFKTIGIEELEILNLVEKGGERLKYLVDNLIDISRIEYDKFNLKKQVSDICDVIRETSKEMKHVIKVRELTLNLRLPERLDLDFDKVRIEQVIMNLLSNAIKNTPPKGTISIKVSKRDNHVVISVRDSGIGLTKEEMEIIFTRFGKIERYGDGLEYIDIQGSGLGLFISKEIVSLHGGTIRAESEGRNKGCTLVVKLPID